VGGGTVLVALLALLLRRLCWLQGWFPSWFRTSMRLAVTAGGLCLLAWFLSESLSEAL
jgi:hypothetical protein